MTRRRLRRAVATWAVLGVMLGACGHYGPPVRPKPSDDRAGVPQPAHDAPDDEDHRDEP
jgi:hypothetical protein